MNRSLIIGASGGIGAALAEALDGEVTTLSRSVDGFDVTDEASIENHLSGLKRERYCWRKPENGNYRSEANFNLFMP